jgi:hypothetical protein
MQVDRQETFSRWLGLVPLFVAVGLSAAVILHFAFNLPMREISGPVGTLVLIQMAIYVPMFWLRRRFRLTRNPRPAIAVFGAYLLIIALAAFHYGTELKLVEVHQSDYLAFSAVVIAATLLLLLFNRKWKLTE